jgi:DMSO reductase family type II enzyme chaperone
MNPATSRKPEVASGEWAARTDTPKRSVFGNFRVEDSRRRRASAPADRARVGSDTPDHSMTVRAPIDLALARSFIYRFLAKAYEDPTADGWAWLCDAATLQSLRTAMAVVASPQESDGAVSLALNGALHALSSALCRAATTGFRDAYVSVFGHAARGSCPLNEIEYGDIKADPLFQPHRLADLAAFYRAFGLEVAADAGERHDHICLQLEFMCVLAAKEAYALQHHLAAVELAECRAAQKKFLREHLGRWAPAFTRRLAATTSEPSLASLARFTYAFIESECSRAGVKPGSEDLLLRPVDETADRLCDSCGIRDLPPGALATT